MVDVKKYETVSTFVTKVRIYAAKAVYSVYIDVLYISRTSDYDYG